MDSLLYQAILFGITVVLIGLLVSMALASLKPELPKECEEWDKNYVMEISLFAIGFIIRYLLENTAVKKYLYN